MKAATSPRESGVKGPEPPLVEPATVTRLLLRPFREVSASRIASSSICPSKPKMPSCAKAGPDHDLIRTPGTKSSLCCRSRLAVSRVRANGHGVQTHCPDRLLPAGLGLVAPGWSGADRRPDDEPFDTQRAILTAAAEHPEHLAYPLERLPAGARQKVAQALLKNDLVIGVYRPAYDAHAKWTVDGEEMLLKITDDGLRAIGIDPNAGDAAADTAPTGGEHAAAGDAPAQEAEPPQAAPVAPTPRTSLHDAAKAVQAVWDDEANREGDMIGALDAPMETLRTLLAGTFKPTRVARNPATPRKPREGTKQEAVLTMLRRPDGATIAQIVDATGWQQHTVRGFFAGLKKRQGIAVEVMERVRQVGPNKDGAKGSYSIYRIAG
jgi:hypothetical protein